MALETSPVKDGAPSWLRLAKAQVPMAVGVIVLLIGVAMLARKLQISDSWPLNTDLGAVYLRAAKAILHGQQPYNQLLYEHDPYGYPPLFGMLIAALTLVLGFGRAWYAWIGASLCAVFAFCAMIMRGFGVKLSWGWVVLAAGTIILGHIGRSDLFHGQPGYFLVTLFVFGLMQFRAGKSWLGALSWAGVIVCKPFMGVMVFYLLRRGEWKSAIRTVGAAAVLFVVPFLMFGSQAVKAVFDWLGASRWYTTMPNVAKYGNQCLYGFFHRLFAENEYTTPWVNAPWLIPVLMAGLFVVVAGGIYLAVDTRSQFTARPKDEAGGQDLLQVALPLGFVFAYGPLTESPHMYMLLPALMGSGIIFARRLKARAPNLNLWAAAFVAWCLTLGIFAIPFGLKMVTPYSWTHLSGLGILASGQNGVMTLVACVLSVMALQSDRKAAPALKMAPA